MMMRLIIVTLILFSANAYAGHKWEAKIPTVASDLELWPLLLDELEKQGMHYGELATAHRMLTYFEDIKIKEKSYLIIIRLIDNGYPFPTSKMFETGDIDPIGDYALQNGYNFYKALVNQNKGMQRWADYFLNKVDKEGYNKFHFYAAVEEYKKKNFDEAIRILKKILKTDFVSYDHSFVRKIARTLARIYFEQKRFKESLDIYETFLLKQNPIAASDWLEVAWNHYYLKNYQQAIGYLYNLESKLAEYPILLEQYILRAAIYMDLCATEQVNGLLEEFNHRFGQEILGIITGQSLVEFRALKSIYHPQSQFYFQAMQTIRELKQEYKSIKKLDRRVRKLGVYIYRTEIKMLTKAAVFFEEEAINRSASELVMLSESLKFLKHRTEREKFNPTIVFQKNEDSKTTYVRDLLEKGFFLSWKQAGDYWRDERNKYLGLVKSQCDI